MICIRYAAIETLALLKRFTYCETRERKADNLPLIILHLPDNTRYQVKKIKGTPILARVDRIKRIFFKSQRKIQNQTEIKPNGLRNSVPQMHKYDINNLSAFTV